MPEVQPHHTSRDIEPLRCREVLRLLPPSENGCNQEADVAAYNQ